MKTVEFLGVSFNDISAAEVIADIFEFLHQDRQARSGRVLVTPNMDFLTRLHARNADRDFGQAIQDADYCLCDSRIVRLLAGIMGTTINHVVTGSDLTRELLNRLDKTRHGVAIVGPQAEDIDILLDGYDINLLDHDCPPFGFIGHVDYVRRLCERLARAEIDILFLAVGSPRQELLASRLKEQGSKAVLLCIGASIDFLAGKERRAPVLIQKMHMEWLFRFCRQPRRLGKRYFRNFIFMFKALFGFADKACACQTPRTD